jgi:hypothetical protein
MTVDTKTNNGKYINRQEPARATGSQVGSQCQGYKAPVMKLLMIMRKFVELRFGREKLKYSEKICPIPIFAAVVGAVLHNVI